MHSHIYRPSTSLVSYPLSFAYCSWHITSHTNRYHYSSLSPIINTTYHSTFTYFSNQHVCMFWHVNTLYQENERDQLTWMTNNAMGKGAFLGNKDGCCWRGYICNRPLHARVGMSQTTAHMTMSGGSISRDSGKCILLLDLVIHLYQK